MGHFCDVVRTGDGQGPVDTEPYLGHETMSHATSPDFGHRRHTIDRRNRLGDASDDGRIDGIEETLADVASGVKTDDQDGGSDHEAHDGVRPLSSEAHGNGADKHE